MYNVSILTMIGDNCRNLGIGLLVFSASLMIQAIISLHQTSKIELKNQTRLTTLFGQIAVYLFIMAGLFLLSGILWYKNRVSGNNWLAMAYPLGLVGGSFLAWYIKLKSSDQERFGRITKTVAWILLAMAILLLFTYIFIYLAIGLNWFSATS